MKTSTGINIKHKSAFTLVQLLLIIVVLAAMTVYSMRGSQDNLVNLQVNKTAVQIQRILEASTLYYKTKAHWPNDINDLVQEQYLPNIPSAQGGMQNPWSADYVVKPLQGEQGETFEVNTQLPNVRIANELKILLPNATIDGTTLHSQITSENKPNDMIFVGAENNIASTNISSCPGAQTACLSHAKQRYYEKLCQNQYGRIADYDVTLQAFSGGNVPVVGEVISVFGKTSIYDFYDVKIRKVTRSGRWGYRLSMDRQYDNTTADTNVDILNGSSANIPPDEVDLPDDLHKKGLSHEGHAVMFVYCRPIPVHNQN